MDGRIAGHTSDTVLVRWSHRKAGEGWGWRTIYHVYNYFSKLVGDARQYRHHKRLVIIGSWKFFVHSFSRAYNGHIITWHSKGKKTHQYILYWTGANQMCYILQFQVLD